MINLEENKKALMASIRKYRRTIKLLEENKGKKIETRNYGDKFIGKKEIPYGPESCPLCVLYWWNDCYGCCIEEDVDVTGCENTPYPTYDNTLIDSTIVTKKLIKATKDELKYLENLYSKLKTRKVQDSVISD